MDREKRLRAWNLFRRGLSRAEVARELGIAASTASRWHRAFRHGGRSPGRPPRLTPGAARQVNEFLRSGPRAQGFDLDEWNAASVAWLIERHTGIQYHRRHVGRLLRRLGWVLPPFGRHAKHAFVRVPLRDPDGNVLAVLGAVRADG